jgi:cell division protein FtsW
MSFSRTDRSRVAQWWFTVDHGLIAALLTLVGTGLVLSLAASPAVAVKKGLPAFYFVERHVAFALIGLAVMLAVSLLDPRAIRRLSLTLLGVALVALVAVLQIGVELNGARRWLSITGQSLQPSEIAKPAFVVVSAWLLAEAQRRSDMPALPMAAGLLAVLMALFLMQPDVGQTLLIALVWGTMFFLSGQPVRAALGLVGLGLAGIVGAYFTFDHVRQRVDKFLFAGSGDNSQVDRAVQSFGQGGFLGRGPGEGTLKTALPDAHTDFILAVVAEEYGVLACLALLGLFAFVVLRAFLTGWREPDPATRLAVIGLALLLGLQAMINMAVNVGLMPAKGLTLPFISAGGSSLIAVSLTAGMLLALTRRRADPARLKTARIAVTVKGLEERGSATP